MLTPSILCSLTEREPSASCCQGLSLLGWGFSCFWPPLPTSLDQSPCEVWADPSPQDCCPARPENCLLPPLPVDRPVHIVHRPFRVIPQRITPLAPLLFLAKGVRQACLGCEAALDLQRDSGPRPALLSGHVDMVKGAESRLGGRTPAVWSQPLIGS